ncbi:MAG: hypothetical protein EAS52_08435 [Parapedobacter sp.]|nr:MAG: hypothetical protein EAS52_08435 [Parapedobacter sp.]
MKKTFRWLMGAAALSITLVASSCSDNEDPTPEPDGGFEVVRDDLKGEINKGEVVLESGTYKLTGKLIVKEGAKLTIKAGVTVEATATNEMASVRYIGVAQGGQIDIQGTATSPVVLTAQEHKPGAWGGLVICGRAPINKGATAVSEVGELNYGGTDVNDNSGSVKYLRIEYSGYAYNSEKEFNALSLFGVGSGTTIEYVQAFEGSDDGFEWFGGTVKANNLVVTNKLADVGDDLFDWTEGWVGGGENWYGIRTNAGNRGIEADNNSENHLADPISNPTIKNVTLIGGSQETSSEPQALKLRVGTKGRFDNLVLSNWATGFDVENDEGIGYVGEGSLKATRVKFDNVTTKAKGKKTDGSSANVDGVFTEDASATGAGAGTAKPEWANNWTVGLD